MRGARIFEFCWRRERRMEVSGERKGKVKEKKNNSNIEIFSARKKNWAHPLKTPRANGFKNYQSKPPVLPNTPLFSFNL